MLISGADRAVRGRAEALQHVLTTQAGLLAGLTNRDSNIALCHFSAVSIDNFSLLLILLLTGVLG